MKKLKNIALPLAVLVIVLVVSGYANNVPNTEPKEQISSLESKDHQTINLFVTHGHCSTPFAGVVTNLQLDIASRSDQGNPLENMHISFEVDPNTFNVCRAKELTATIRKPGLFVGEHNEKITFTSTNVYTMGVDWYQVNGKMAIKGIEKEVKFFVTGIRDPKETIASSLVLSGQVNLLDWGIDYDKIVNGKSNSVPTKWLYLNMRFDVPAYQPSLVTVSAKEYISL
ncbi:YceI-like domain protein [Kordia sp. SMS9]|uniref:YceI family protein n=1 Tax=Kordia sp. SMS9 TaxID=2282170 RepID=UPI000E0D61CF|nr:YceI family protein [Kordia sp. SMS9]AXG67985.1 YceI-like domain protein [Kordia sp. SMS9]